MANTMYIPLGEYIDSLWPTNILEPPALDRIGKVWIEPLNIESEPTFTVKTAILFEQELSLAIPGIDGVSIVCAGAGHDSAFLFEFFTEPTPGMRIVDVPIAIRFSKDLLKPATLVTDAEGRPVAQEDTTRDHVDITLAKVTLTAEFDGDFGIEVEGGIDLPLCLIGETGVGIEARNISFVRASDTPPPGRPAGWRGIHIPEAGVFLPGELGAVAGHITLTNATIGNGGFSGTVNDTWAPPLSASLGGMDLTLQSVAISFVQNSLTQCQILGSIKLPFFDVPLDVEIGLNLDGSFAVKLASANGLVTIEKPDLLELEVHSLGFTWAAGTLIVKTSGKIRPLVGGLDWPAFDVKELSIDSHGNVKVDGGWLDLRDGYALDFHGFTIELTKIGFGRNDEGGKWVGFSGALKLIDEIAAGASVDGLRITWYEDGSREPKITLDGVGVEVLIPDAIAFKGLVSYKELVDAQSGEIVHRFDGAIMLKLLALDLEIDGVLVIGSAPKAGGGRYTFAAIYLATELPAGIPLWSTGLALYGFAGLFAVQMAPDKRADEEWYGIGPADGWFKRPAIGVTDLTTKWRNEEGSLAVGAGLTIGTLADNGFTFNGRMVLVLSLPGPILMIEGRGNILKERSKLSDEPIFRALTVLDGRAGTMLFGLDAQYKAGANGELIDIRGSVEAFFDLHDHDRWHLYLGLEDPREKRIRAQLFSLFESNAYLMIDSHALRTGAWVGYDKKWKYGPVKITLEAWLETNVAVNRKPIHFHGDLWAHGKFEMRVFGFGFGIALDAKLAGDVFDPFHILAELSVELNLPWPLPNVDVDVTFEWGPELTPPPIPIVLKEVAIEHFKVTTSWPLPRTHLLLPDFDRDGFLGPALGPAVPADLNQLPVVPLDCRPHLTFGRPVHDAALIGINPQPPNPAEERIGDPAANEGPARIEYSLRAVTLEKLAAGAWTTVARKGDTPNPPGLPELFGSWAPVPALGSDPPAVGQVKLWLWSKTPFDYTRGTSGSWDEWFTGQYTEYPCIPDATSQHLCCNFTRYKKGASLDAPHVCDPALQMFGFPADRVRVNALQPPIEGLDRAACVLPEGSLFIQFARPAHHLEVLLAPVADGIVDAIVVLSDSTQLPPVTSQNGRITIALDKIAAVRLRGKSTFCVVRVCADLEADPEDVLEHEEMSQHLQTATAVWSQTGTVLEPNTAYRLKIVTRAAATGEGEMAGWTDTREQEEIAYFRTQGPPGLTTLSLPVGQPAPDAFDSGLDDLTPYVQQTVPPTVAAPGQRPVLPKPVYRAYDVGVAFNEDYVDLMYRIAGRDLGLYLFDNNNVPVRDAAGRLVVRPNAWGHQETLTLDASEQRWIQVVNGSTCAVIAEETIPKDVTLAAAAPGQVLAPDAVHEARLVPLLLHETFAALAVGATATGPSGALGRWRIVDQGTAQGPSVWRIAETPAPVTRYVVQTTNIWGGTTDGTDPVKPGSMLILGDDPNLAAGDPDQPSQWTDYRATVYLRDEDNDAVGLVFRYVDPDNYYRFSMDGERKYRRLVRVVNGVHTILAEDDRRYRSNVDYAITIEAIGASLEVYVDGAPILEASDDTHPRGTIGLYCWAAEKARFFDVTVDDFRAADPVYTFQFTTSKFAHVAHHVHSFDDVIHPGEIDPSVDAQGLLAAAVPPGTPLSDDESRAYDALARAVLGSAADAQPSRFELTRVVQNGDTIGLLAQTSEPLDWSRLALEVSTAPLSAPLEIVPPESLKITGVSFGTMTPDQESVDLITRQPLDPGGYALQVRQVPGPIAADDVHQYFFEDFGQDGLGLLFEETFGPNALDRYVVVDQDTATGPSNWAVSGGTIQQLSNIGGSPGASDLSKPGTIAVTGDLNWSNVRIRASMLSTGIDGIGLVFRYRGPDNFYRFSADNRRSFRRLVKCVDGAFTLLWEDTTASYEPNTPFDLQIDLFGNRLIGSMDGLVLFDLTDGSFAQGQVGLYSWMNAGSSYRTLHVQSLDADPVLFRSGSSLDGWLVLDAADATAGPSAWAAGPDGITQSSPISVPGSLKLGAHLVTKNAWDDVQVIVDLKSAEDGAVGVLLRYRDRDNYYRFSMNRDESYRRLEKCVDGVMLPLWDSTDGFDLDRTYRLSLRARGTTIAGAIDGQSLFSVTDVDHARGGAGLYTSSNAGASFNRIWVMSLADSVGAFRIVDGEGLSTASAWRTAFGELQQESAIGETTPLRRGTHAIAPVQPPSIMRLIVDVRSDGDAPIGVLFRYQDERNYYRLSLSTVDQARMLVKFVGGVASLLWQTAGGYAPETTHRIIVDTFGDRLIGYLDGEKLFDVRDASLPGGRVGLYVSSNDVAAFNSIEVTTPPLESNALFTDAFAAGDLTAWTFVSEATVGGPPAWSVADGVLAQTSEAFQPPESAQNIEKRGVFAVAGDSTWSDIVLSARLRSNEKTAIGVMFRYQDQDHYYRFSMDRDLSYRRVVKNVGGVFTVLWEDEAQFEIGRAYEVVIVARGTQLWGYLDGVVMFAVEDGDMATGRIALYCWRNPAAAFSSVSVLPIDAAMSAWAFKDDFPHLVVDRWTFVDVGTTNAPAKWSVQAGQLTQTSAIAGADPREGTYAVAATGARNWTDARLTAGLSSSTDGTVGIAARYRNSDNHYRFEVSLESKGRRLVKVVDGQETTLWSDAKGYAKDAAFVAALECVGTRLSCYVNGVKVCDAVDDALSGGRIALFTSGNAGAAFDFVRVQEAAWMQYYRFPRVPTLPAGQRIRVLASGPQDAPAPMPNVRDEFVAGPGGRGRLHFLATCCDLRIVDPRGNAEHTRTIVRADRYAPLPDLKVLRRRDGCGFFVVTSEADEHRLGFTYRRDNTVLDPDSLVLREAGDSSPEAVGLDVP